MPYKIYLRPAYPNELYHHGIKGQKWGVRRFQNPDGTLTAAGKKRYYTQTGSLSKRGLKEVHKATRRFTNKVASAAQRTGEMRVSKNGDRVIAKSSQKTKDGNSFNINQEATTWSSGKVGNDVKTNKDVKDTVNRLKRNQKAIADNKEKLRNEIVGEIYKFVNSNDKWSTETKNSIIKTINKAPTNVTLYGDTGNIQVPFGFGRVFRKQLKINESEPVLSGSLSLNLLDGTSITLKN